MNNVMLEVNIYLERTNIIMGKQHSIMKHMQLPINNNYIILQL